MRSDENREFCVLLATTCHINEESGDDEHAGVFDTSLKTRFKDDS